MQRQETKLPGKVGLATGVKPSVLARGRGLSERLAPPMGGRRPICFHFLFICIFADPIHRRIVVLLEFLGIISLEKVKYLLFQLLISFQFLFYTFTKQNISVKEQLYYA